MEVVTLEKARLIIIPDDEYEILMEAIGVMPDSNKSRALEKILLESTVDGNSVDEFCK